MLHIITQGRVKNEIQVYSHLIYYLKSLKFYEKDHTPGSEFDKDHFKYQKKGASTSIFPFLCFSQKGESKKTSRTLDFGS